MKKNDSVLQDFHPEQVDIEERSEKRLKERYPKGIPSVAFRRYREELLGMKRYQREEAFQFMTALHQVAESCGGVISLRGGMGGSFLLYLLCEGRCNPLPAHYYCWTCGHYEASDEYRYAPDMPRKNCPVCGTAMRADGFSIPVYDVFGPKGYEIASRWNVAVSEGFLPYARALQEEYDGKHFLLCGCDQCDRLEKAKQANSYGAPDWETFDWGKIDWEKIAKIESHEDVAKALRVLQPKTFRQTLAVLGCVSGTYKNRRGLLPDIPMAYATLSLGQQLEQYPAFHREDICDYLLSQGLGEEAEEMATRIGKGQHNRKNGSQRHEIPDCIGEIASNICYLFPRSHNVERLWLDAQIVLLEEGK